MKLIRGSVIIPVYNRQDTIDRAIGSILDLGTLSPKGAWEVIVIDDASTDDTVKRVEKWKKRFPKNVVLLQFQDHLERVVAMNAGLRTARGEWLIRLDSDDEMASHFRKAVDDATDTYPNAELLNWGSLVHWRRDGKYHKTEVRKPFIPSIGDDGTIEPFKSGTICNGGFIFKRELLFKAGFLREATNCYKFGEMFLNRFEELKPLYTMEDGKLKTDLGNPWGDDFALFYALTREAMPYNIEQILHTQHVRI